MPNWFVILFSFCYRLGIVCLLSATSTIITGGTVTLAAFTLFVVTEINPVGIAGLIIAAIFAAAVSISSGKQHFPDCFEFRPSISV